MYNLKYREIDGPEKDLSVSPGEILFVLGANGTGKSTLMHQFAQQRGGAVRRVLAQRQVWFASDTLNLTPHTRMVTENQIQQSDRRPQSRTQDDIAHQRAQAVLYDLVEAENKAARELASAFRSGQLKEANALKEKASPLSEMNRVLRMAGLGFEVLVEATGRILAVRPNCEPYGVAELSDGERNALIVAATVLTAPGDSLIIVDEPERHLHRSIVSPLISEVVSCRSDCAFVISTHDAGLPLDQPRCRIALTRRFSWSPRAWSIDLVDGDCDAIDDSTLQSVLGARRVVLFVEGRPSSLDLQLYEILFPQVSVRAVGSCAEVEKIVSGLRASRAAHWLNPIGVVDGDSRPSEKREAMLQMGIVPLKQYSVESLYYHPETIAGVSRRMAGLRGESGDRVAGAALDSAITVFERDMPRLAARVAAARARYEIMCMSPDAEAMMGGRFGFEHDSRALYEAEVREGEALLASRDLDGLVSRYPIRETSMPCTVARAIGFPGARDYEKSVRAMLLNSEDAKVSMLRLLDPLPMVVSPACS